MIWIREVLKFSTKVLNRPKYFYILTSSTGMSAKNWTLRSKYPNPQTTYLQIFVKMFPSISDEVDKNEQGDDCKWDDIIVAESQALKKDEPMFTDNEKIEDNKVTLGYWILPFVEVKSPNGGESYEVGEKVNVKWKVKTTHHDKDDQVKIDIMLYGSDELLLTIVSTEENDSFYHWIVPEELAGRNDLKIKIVAVDGNSLTAEDISDGTFEVLGDLVD